MIDSPAHGDSNTADDPGLTTWAFDQPPERQLSACGKLHAACGSGTAVLGFEERPTVERVFTLLEYAWRQTEVVRLRLLVRPPAAPQGTLLPA